MERRKELEARAREYENGLLSKRPRSACVTEPKVDKALSIWFKDKTKEGKAVPRAMLEAKRRLVEEELNIPEEKRLHWGWIQSFLRANKPQGTQKSQKASSADNQPLSQPGTLSHCQPIPPVNNDRSITSRTLNVHSTSPLPDKGVSSARGSNTTPTDHAMVEQERLRIQALLAKFAPKDRWNADEAALIICTAPEQGERKSNSSRITVCLACNADGSEKKEVFFIGKDESSHCFAGVEPDQREFYYRCQKNAWMTRDLFKEWLVKWDLELASQQRHIALMLDNFKGHYIDYNLKNITLIPFVPKLTRFLQPLDVGIIRRFKDQCRLEYHLRVLKLEEQGDQKSYKIGLLEIMRMVEEAWKATKQNTITRYWEATGIQAIPPIRLRRPDPVETKKLRRQAGWDIIVNFATGQLSLLQVEEQLVERLDGLFDRMDWEEALDTVMNAKGDVQVALASLANLAVDYSLDSQFCSSYVAATEEYETGENDVAESVTKLKGCSRSFGKNSGDNQVMEINSGDEVSMLAEMLEMYHMSDGADC